jgi:hypothetical protein
MAKRKFAALVTALVMGFVVQPLQAKPLPEQSLQVGVDGCAQLARVVYSEVSAAALYGPGRSGPWLIDAAQGDVSLCSTTAKTVSRAFTSAMNSAGFEVSWQRPVGSNGDFCASGFLSQCYPDRFPIGTGVFGRNAMFVSQSWSVVSQSVMRQMYNPFSSDEIRFRDSDLKLRLGLSLRTVRSADLKLRLE